LPTVVNHVYVLKDGGISLWEVNANGACMRLSHTLLGQNNYKVLKEIAHLALMMPSLTQLIRQSQDVSCQIKSVREILQVILAKKSDLNEDLTTLNSGQLCVMSQLVKLSLEYIDGLSSTAIHDLCTRLTVYLAKTKPLIAKTMQWAAEEQLRLLNEEVHNLADIHRLDWARTRAVIVVAHQANQDLIEASYCKKVFAEHLGLPIEQMKDNYVYSIECPPPLFGHLDIEQDLLQNILAKCEWDKVIGKEVFNDSTAVFKDLLAEPAKQVLEEMQVKCPIRTWGV